ncbi:MAG TPA: carbon monoxide dehydrogenase subunit G [Casimicrobiaceae bacterium]|nr:carbon monoxide dehydrogenase subunit G [Casimicrobiaceae bacterium]
MELSNTRTVPLPRAVVWNALNDPAVLKDCVPGCESMEPDGEHAWRVVMAARVGPVSARFNGRMSLTDIHEPESYTLQFDGQGGAAGFARGDARVTLKQLDERQTELSYVAKAQIGGKLAQIGSRLVDGAAAKLADDFFARFVTRAAPSATPAPTSAASSEVVAADDTSSTPLAPGGGSPWIRYAAIIAIVVVLIVLYVRGYR